MLRIVFWVHFYCCKQCFCFCLSWDLTSRQPFTSSSEIDDVIKVRACIMVGLGTCRPETSVGFKYGVKTNRIAASLYAVLWTCWDLTENAYRCRASLLEQSFWQHVNMTTTMIWQSTTVTSSGEYLCNFGINITSRALTITLFYVVLIRIVCSFWISLLQCPKLNIYFTGVVALLSFGLSMLLTLETELRQVEFWFDSVRPNVSNGHTVTNCR